MGDNGSDLDVFEGLTKNKSAPPSAGTRRGHLKHTQQGHSKTSRPAPPPAARPAPSSIPLPPPSHPPATKRGPGAISTLPRPKTPPPPSKKSTLPPMSTPSISVKNIQSVSGVLVEQPREPNVLPGDAVPDLDWDDEEEATHIVTERHGDLFEDLDRGAARHRRPAAGASVSSATRSGPGSGRRSLGGARALLAASGGAAAAVHRTPPIASSVPRAADSMPKIPAPAPVPRDISSASAHHRGRDREPASRASYPSWQPQTAERSGGGSKALYILAAFAAVAIVAALFFYSRSKASAPLVINVTHQGKVVAKADIYVDGQKTQCEFAPCTLELKPGKKSIRVVSGPLAGSQDVTLEGGRDTSVEIALGVSSDVAPFASATTPAPVSDKPASLKIPLPKKGAKIRLFVDGEDKGLLPVDLKDLKAGTAKLKLVGEKPFGTLEKEVELKGGDTFELKDVKLPYKIVQTTLRLKSRGAVVTLIDEFEGKKTKKAVRFRGTTAKLKLDTDHSYTIEAALRGHDPIEKVLEFEAGEPKLDVDIELERSAVATAAPGPVSPSPGPGPRPPTPPTPPSPPPATGGMGTLNANSIPPSKVMIDGSPRGSTPVMGVKVSAGRHTVVFRHPDYGTKTRTVTVKPGKSATAAVRFKK